MLNHIVIDRCRPHAWEDVQFKVTQRLHQPISVSLQCSDSRLSPSVSLEAVRVGGQWS